MGSQLQVESEERDLFDITRKDFFSPPYQSIFFLVKSEAFDLSDSSKILLLLVLILTHQSIKTLTSPPFLGQGGGFDSLKSNVSQTPTPCGQIFSQNASNSAISPKVSGPW